MSRNWLRGLIVLVGVGTFLAGCSTTPAPTAASPQINPKPAVAGYLAPGSIDPSAVVPDPPADDAAATRADLDRLLAIQAARTPEIVARVQTEGALSPYLFRSVLGTNFQAEKLPLTDKLLTRAGADAAAVISQAKAKWNRRRPWVMEPRLQPCIEKPTDSSYPSSRTLRSAVWAGVLAELVPAKKDALQAAADQVGQNRLDSGVHFPADVDAGKKLAQAIVARLRGNAAFQADLAAARAEAEKVLVP